MVVLLLITFLFSYTTILKSYFVENDLGTPKKRAAYILKHKFSLDMDQGVPRDLQERFKSWKYYRDGVLGNPLNFIFGHEKVLNRDLAPRAYNYYLDLVYNFGFISLVPFIFLIVHTLSKLYQRIRATKIPLDLLGLAALVLFFVLVDNSMKVGFRQPYPGIIMFFLWGVLLNRLSNDSNQDEKPAVTR